MAFDGVDVVRRRFFFVEWRPSPEFRWRPAHSQFWDGRGTIEIGATLDVAKYILRDLRVQHPNHSADCWRIAEASYDCID